MPRKASALSHCNIDCASAKWFIECALAHAAADRMADSDVDVLIVPGSLRDFTNLERRLSAILAADVVGYSRLMGANEVGTLTALNGRRTEVIEPRIAEHKGRVVKLTGDGLLVEFPSVVNAVECATSIQQEMRWQNADIPEDRRIELRIGINLGDVIAEGDLIDARIAESETSKA